MRSDKADLKRRILAHMHGDSLLHLIHLPLCVTDPDGEDNPIVYVNDAFQNLTGYAREEVMGRNCRFLQGEDTTRKSVEEVRRAIDSGTTAVVEIVNYKKDGSRFINSLQMSPVRDDDGTVILLFGSQIDISHRHRQEKERQSLETAELVHRLKNIVNVMSSVIRLSAREIADREELLSTIQQRLKALSDSHFHSIDFQSGPPVDAKVLTRLIVEPYAPQTGHALSISGTPAQIGSDYLTALSLVLHELATNATKHGAFSTITGRVNIVWAHGEADRQLTMTWTERGGPPVDLAGRANGSHMIQTLLRGSGGELVYDWQQEGLVARVCIPAIG